MTSLNCKKSYHLHLSINLYYSILFKLISNTKQIISKYLSTHMIIEIFEYRYCKIVILAEETSRYINNFIMLAFIHF